jgi:hypothetical protein
LNDFGISLLTLFEKLNAKLCDAGGICDHMPTAIFDAVSELDIPTFALSAIEKNFRCPCDVLMHQTGLLQCVMEAATEAEDKRALWEILNDWK